MAYIGHLITTIDAGQHMTTLNLNQGIAFYPSSFMSPNSGSGRIITRSATEYIAIEGMTVGSRNSTTFSIITCCIGKLVMRSVSVLFTIVIGIYTIRPACTFWQRCLIIARNRCTIL